MNVTVKVEWIPVDERLPEKEYPVLVSVPGEVSKTVAYYDLQWKVWRPVDQNWQYLQGITHWAELPAPPQIETPKTVMGVDQTQPGCKVTNQEVIQRLWDLGYFFCPHALAYGKIEASHLAMLKLTDNVVQATAMEYQERFISELSQFTLRSAADGGHAREAVADGDVGECTKLLLTMPRCGVPDYRNPELAVEEGNWPDACRHEITTSYKMSLRGLTDAELEELWIAADKNWSDVLDVDFQLRQSDYPNTRFHADAQRLGGSTLAWHYLAVSNCSAKLAGAYDSDRTWSQRLFIATCTHEHGHGLGFEHTRDSQSTMYPSINNAAMERNGAPNKTDLAEADRRGYRRRTTPTPPTPDPDPPTPPAPGPSPHGYKIKIPAQEWEVVPQ